MIKSQSPIVLTVGRSRRSLAKERERSMSDHNVAVQASCRAFWALLIGTLIGLAAIGVNAASPSQSTAAPTLRHPHSCARFPDLHNYIATTVPDDAKCFNAGNTATLVGITVNVSPSLSKYTDQQSGENLRCAHLTISNISRRTTDIALDFYLDGALDSGLGTSIGLSSVYAPGQSQKGDECFADPGTGTHYLDVSLVARPTFATMFWRFHR
jgi:hypothetical protein